MLPVKPSNPRNGQGVVAVVLNIATWVQVNHSLVLASRRQTLQVHHHVVPSRNHSHQLRHRHVLEKPRNFQGQALQKNVGFRLHVVSGKEPSQTLTQCSLVDLCDV